MALQWCDDFGSYGTSTAFMLNGLYALVSNASLVDDPDPTITQTVLRITNGVENHREPKVRKVLSSSQATVGVAFRLWCASLPSGGGRYPVPVAFSDASNNLLYELRMLSTGALVMHNYVTGISYTAAIPSIVANGWQHVEVKAVQNASTGSFEVRVEGVVVISESGLNTGNTPISQVRIDGERELTNGFPTFYMKDYVIWDGSGSQNNDFLGSVSVKRLTPNSDVALNWVPSTGPTGWDLLAQSPPDDAEYIRANAPPPAASVFTFTDLPPDVTSVRGLMTLVRGRKSDGGDGNLQTAVSSNGFDDLGANRPMTTAFTYWYDFSELNPNTGLPWAPIEVDAMEGQVNRTL